MLPPYELEKTEFRKAVKGYNVADVKEHIDFIVDKYTELYRAYNELEQKYAEAVAELQTYKNNEDAIRRALVTAQNNKKSIIDDANRRAEIILKSAKQNCERIISSFREQILRERNTLQILKAQVEQFKQSIFEQYQKHIEYLEEISPEHEAGSEWIMPDGKYAAKVLAQVMLDVERSEKESEAKKSGSKESEDFDLPIDDTTLDTLLSDKPEPEDEGRTAKEEEKEPVFESDPEIEKVREEIERTIQMGRRKEDGSGESYPFAPADPPDKETDGNIPIYTGSDAKGESEEDAKDDLSDAKTYGAPAVMLPGAPPPAPTEEDGDTLTFDRPPLKRPTSNYGDSSDTMVISSGPKE